MDGRVIKQNDGGGEYTMIYYKNFCKCHSVSSAQLLKKKSGKE
jgi:hypothetical protein